MFILIARDSSGRVVGSIRVGAEAQLIGRAPSSALVLPSTGVSRSHASVYLHGDAVVIRDEGSANGVKVDGELITGPTLVDQSNRIQLSSFMLTLQREGAGDELPPTAGIGVAPLAPDTAEELDTRLEAHSGAASALASSTLELVGRGGPYDGTRFEISKPMMSVGRVDDNDIVLEDPSVSRKHAQLRLSVTGRNVTILDLRSHNGSYVNGERTKRAELEVGGVVRFGDLAFKLEHSRMAGSRRKTSPRRRLLIALGGVVALLGIIGGVAYWRRPPPKVIKRMTPEERLRKLQAEVQAVVDSAKLKLQNRRWSSAVVLLDRALTKDPLNGESKTLRERALSELQNEKIYEEGLKYFALGNRENLVKAKGVFSKIGKRSVYAREVRYKLREIDERVAEGFRIDGVSRCKARYWTQCQKALCRFFELMPKQKQVPGEPGLRRLLQVAEKRIRRRKRFVACRADRYLNPPDAASSKERDPGELLAEKYTVKRVREIVRLYVDGKIDVALKLLNKLKHKRAMRPHLEQITELDRQLLIIRGKYQEGFSALRGRKAVVADREWSMLLAADRAILPKGVTSFYRMEVLRELGNLYFDLGDEQFKATRYRSAFSFWRRGKKLNPSHGRLLNGMLQLEKVAQRLLREGRAASVAGRVRDARRKLTLVRDICEADRPLRKEAVKELSELGG